MHQSPRVVLIQYLLLFVYRRVLKYWRQITIAVTTVSSALRFILIPNTIAALRDKIFLRYSRCNHQATILPSSTITSMLLRLLAKWSVTLNSPPLRPPTTKDAHSSSAHEQRDTHQCCQFVDLSRLTRRGDNPSSLRVSLGFRHQSLLGRSAGCRRLFAETAGTTAKLI